MTGFEPSEADDVRINVMMRADSSDLREVALLNVLAWGGQADEHDLKHKAATLREHLATLDFNAAAMLGARKVGTLVGFCQMQQDSSNAAHWWIMGLVVHPAHRRCGIGGALTRAGIRYAREHGAAVIRSETHDDNPVSIRFHEAFGFANDGRFTASDGDRKVAFSLDLA